MPVGPALLAPPSKARELRAIRWKRPGPVYPKAIEIALSHLKAAADRPRSPIWRAVFGNAPVPGKSRQRAKRTDGGINVLSLLSAMLASADEKSGLVATPINDIWDRHTWDTLGYYAYGPVVPHARSLRRTERAGAQLIALGLIRSNEWKITTVDGVRSQPGYKLITEKCWKLLNAWKTRLNDIARKAMQGGIQRKKKLEADLGVALRNAKSTTPQAPAPVNAPAAARRRSEPPSQAGPTNAGTVAAAEIAKLKNHFSKD